MQAMLALEDGRIFRGEGYGAQGECRGEVVFNTSLTGYQEIFTDPSYAGQIVVLTNPQIGNYGTNDADNEARKPYIEGLVTREFSPISSNWRSQQVADEYLERWKVPVISEIDTRALVRHLRNNGVMRGVISTVETNPDVLVEKARSIRKMDGTDLASVVSTKDRYEWEHDGPDPLRPEDSQRVERPDLHVVAYDYGIKKNILRMLGQEGCRVTVVPAQTSAEDVLALKPDGIFLSNGPGDPAAVGYAAEAMRGVLGAGVPVFGICFGSQVMGRALGLQTYKLRFGHRGVNQPVQDLRTGRVQITSHNHGFAVAMPEAGETFGTAFGPAAVTHVNLNDGVVEGLRLLDAPAFSVQYHPEAAPGPHDATDLFETFAESMERHR